MIITYSPRHRAYTAYGFPIRGSIVFRQLTGYHPTPQQARAAAKAWTHGERYAGVGTVTGRFSKSQPELQDPHHRHKPDGDFVSTDYPELEKRALAGIMDPINMTATQAAEARDKFNEAYPKVRGWWDEVKKDIAEQSNTPKDRLGDSTFESLYMQQPVPIEDQRKPASGRRSPLTPKERARVAKIKAQRASE